MDAFWAAPPTSRTLAASALILSIWRLVTPFLITGKDLSIIFDTYFKQVYQYGSKLEAASPKFPYPGDFFTYVVFVAITILLYHLTIAVPGIEEDYPCIKVDLLFAVNPMISLVQVLNILVTGGVIFTSALVLAFAYTSSQDDRGQKASFFVITIPALWVPYAMLLMNMIMVGPHSAMVQATGLVAAHLHDFLTRLWPALGGGQNLVPTPSFIRRLWGSEQSNGTKRSYGTAFAPKTNRSTSNQGSSDNVLPESWQNRGSGHRLGGD